MQLKCSEDVHEAFIVKTCNESR